MKKCTTCKIFKEVSFFSIDNSRHDKLCASCKECYSARRKKHYLLNTIRTLENNKKWKEDHKVEYRTSENKREKKRIENDLNFKIKKKLRSRLSGAIKNGSKSGSAVDNLGCSIDFFKTYIEKQFKQGMTWNNRGNGNDFWQLDHIVPLCKFNLTDPAQLSKACHYTNLQPLWHEDHLIKTKLDLRSA
jgi:hypothetical protein